LGTRAGLFHATTGYSFPQAVKLADALAETETFCSESMFKWSRLIADHHWKGQQFFRLLNRLLFRAAVPSERYKVLEKFYRLPDISIHRFYAGELSKFDQLRILSGKPPVSVLRAISCIFEKEKGMS
jgi:lycopene beta-cyclase